jgi:hypothetical protein
MEGLLADGDRRGQVQVPNLSHTRRIAGCPNPSTATPTAIKVTLGALWAEPVVCDTEMVPAWRNSGLVTQSDVDAWLRGQLDQ